MENLKISDNFQEDTLEMFSLYPNNAMMANTNLVQILECLIKLRMQRNEVSLTEAET